MHNELDISTRFHQNKALSNAAPSVGLPGFMRIFNMKKTAIASAVLLLTVLFDIATAGACGDKLLYLSRIYRHHELADSTVAVYARPDSLLGNVAALNLDKAFHEEGYHLLLISTDSDLAAALQAGTADVIIADIADAATIEQQASASKVPIIPVIKKDDSASAAAAKHYVAVIKSPVKSDKFLDALDRAFESKEMRQKRSAALVNSASVR